MSRNPTAASATIAPSARPLASNATNLLMAEWTCRSSPPGSRRAGRGCGSGGGRCRDLSDGEVLDDLLASVGVELDEVGVVVQHVGVVGLVRRTDPVVVE